jgi:hypothetical protein
MGKRTRTNMGGLVVHVTPNGKRYTSPKERCEQKLRHLEELLKQDFKVAKVKKVADGCQEVKCFGVTLEIPLEIVVKAKLNIREG